MTAEPVPVGCVTERGLKTLGQTWTVGNGKYRYELECRRKNNVAMPVPARCAYAPVMGGNVSSDHGDVRSYQRYFCAAHVDFLRLLRY